MASRTNIKKISAQEQMDYMLKAWLEGSNWSLNEHDNLHFANESDIHMSIETYKERGFYP